MAETNRLSSPPSSNSALRNHPVLLISSTETLPLSRLSDANVTTNLISLSRHCLNPCPYDRCSAREAKEIIKDNQHFPEPVFLTEEEFASLFLSQHPTPPEHLLRSQANELLDKASRCKIFHDTPPVLPPPPPPKSTPLPLTFTTVSSPPPSFPPTTGLPSSSPFIPPPPLPLPLHPLPPSNPPSSSSLTVENSPAVLSNLLQNLF